MFKKLAFPGTQSLLRCSKADVTVLDPEPDEATSLSLPTSVIFISIISDLI